MAIKLQPQNNSKTRPEGRRKQSRARRGADERERFYINGMGTSGGALADHYVELVVFQRRIEQLFHRRLQPVHLVDKENLLLAQIRQDGGQFAFDLQRWPGRLLKSHAHLVSDDRRQRRLAQPRWPIEQDMIERFAP